MERGTIIVTDLPANAEMGIDNISASDPDVAGLVRFYWEVSNARGLRDALDLAFPSTLAKPDAIRFGQRRPA